MRREDVTWEICTVMGIIVIVLVLGMFVACLLGAPVYFLWFLEQVW